MSEIVKQNSSPIVRGGVIGIQSRMREIGRIRFGVREGTKGFPKSIGNVRLTSNDKSALEAAAAVYGGQVVKWTGDRVPEGQYELITDSEEIHIYASPMPISQHMEMWSGGGCLRRCNGVTDELNDCPCQCDFSADNVSELRQKGKVCTLKTRMSVILARVPGVGCWRVETGSIIAASELPLTYEGLRQSAARGTMIPARLAAPERKIVKGGVTKKFRVIELRVDLTPDEVYRHSASDGVGAVVDASTGEVLEYEQVQSLPPAQPAERAIPEILVPLHDAGMFTPDKADAIKEFKAACTSGGLDWQEIAAEGFGKGLKRWPLLTAFANECAVPADPTDNDI